MESIKIIISVSLVLSFSFISSFLVRWLLIKLSNDTNHRSEDLVGALIAFLMPVFLFAISFGAANDILRYFAYPQVLIIYPIFALILYIMYRRSSD